MKNAVRILLVALSLAATGAYAQSAQDSQSRYDSRSSTGNSANWGVGA